MNNQPIVLNGVYVSNWNSVGHTFSNDSQVLPTANVDKTAAVISNPIQTTPGFYQFPILNTLLQPPQIQQVQPLIQIQKPGKQQHTLSDKTTHKAAVMDQSNNLVHINLEHDYNKLPEPEQSVLLTINLTKYAKGVNVKDIRGIVILLKDPRNNPPIIINNVDLHSSDEYEDDVEVTNDTITSDPIPEPVEPVANDVATDSANKTVYKCKFCPGFSDSKRELKTHMRRDHADQMKRYECRTCKKFYMSKSMLQRHREKVHFIHCAYCDKPYEMARDYKAHLKEDHTDVFYRMCKPFYCEECDKEISEKNNYLTHMRSHGGYVCGVCAERSTSRTEYKTHLDTHPDQHFCPKCNKGFKLKESLRAHDETHNDPLMFACDQCQTGFKTKPMLRQHTLRAHSTRERKHMCDQCPSMFLMRTHLRKHQDVVHAGIRQYECDQCDRKFSNSGNLRQHVDVMHLKVQPYQCEYCGKRFARKDYVVNHSKIHTKPPETQKVSRKKRETVSQPETCNICGKGFMCPMTLNRHLKYIHNGGVRKYKCRHCDRIFPRRKSRMLHEKLHENPENNSFPEEDCEKEMDMEEDVEEYNEPELENYDSELLCDEEYLSHVGDKDDDEDEQL